MNSHEQENEQEETVEKCSACGSTAEHHVEYVKQNGVCVA